MSLKPVVDAMLRLAAAFALLLVAGNAAASHDKVLLLPATERQQAAHALLALEDPTHKLQIGDVTNPVHAARFQPALPDRTTGEVNYSFSKSAWWFALPVSVDAGAAARWLLEIGYSSMDCVEVFTRRADGTYERQMAGDIKAFSERPYPHRNLVFPVTLVPGETQTIYLRVTTEGTVTLPVSLWAPEALAREDRVTYTLLSLYYGMLLALCLYNLLIFLSTRDPTFIAYVAFTIAMAIGQLSMNGFGNQFLWGEYPKWGDIALPVGMALTGLTGAIFMRLFLGTRNRSPLHDRLILLCLVCFVFAVSLPLVMSYRPVAIVVSVFGVAFSVVAVITGIHSVRQGHPGGRYFLLSWFALLLGVAVQGLRVFGLMPTTTLTLYSMQIGSAIELLLLSFAMADRINTIRREKAQSDAAALHANAQLLDNLRKSEQELERRVAERTRELEAANRQLTEKERELRKLALQDPLTGLSNRMFLNDRIERAITRARRSNDRVALLLLDLDNFKPVNDTHGHATGDKLLVEIARRISEAVRESDTVARLGGDEFVILLEDIRETGSMEFILGKLMATIGEPLDLCGRRIGISASIGVAFSPDHADHATQLLERADVELYKAKAGGRNRYSIATNT
jgi:diguanylate cyclase (GGDEF)-like protein